MTRRRVIHADGTYTQQTGKGGWAAVILETKTGAGEISSSSEAELRAVLEAVKMVEGPCTVVTDSVSIVRNVEAGISPQKGATMVATREVTYDVDGLNMIAHLAQPDGTGPWPAVLIGHDGVGLEEYQRQRADDLAAHGYLALAMEYHGGEVFFDRPDAMLARVLPLLADAERMRAIGRAALDALLAQPGVDPDRIAALGYGAGGRIVLELARTGVPFKAVAVVHPAFPDARAEDWTEATGAYLICAGSGDPLCTPHQVLAFGSALQEAGVDWRVNIYGGAEHAFWARPRKPDGSPADGTAHAMVTVPGVGYHPKHTPRAWRAVLDLFGETF